MEIIKQISQQTGIDERQAQDALNGLNDSLQNNVPGPLGGLIGGILSGNSPSAQGDGQIGLDDLMAILSGGQGGAQGGLNRDSLVNDISNRSGVSQDIASQILPIVLSFLAAKLGPQLGEALQGILGGGQQAGTQQRGGNDGFGLDDVIGGILGGGR